MVSRPNSRALAVSQGKGITLDAAIASGVMESIEAWHAEHLQLPVMYNSFEDLRWSYPLINLERLPPRRESVWAPHLRMLWIEAVDLLADAPVLVPHQLVHGDYRLPPPPGASCFCASSNGLASGSTRDEALVHALCEVVERDAVAIWAARGASGRTASRVDPATVDDRDARRLLRRLDAADLATGLWNVTSDIGLPAFFVEITERGRDLPRFHPFASAGSGCHLDRGIALCRAITEAAQSRLTVISGSRDDLGHAGFGIGHDEPALASRRHELIAGTAAADFRAVASMPTPDLGSDIQAIVERLAAIGIEQVAMIDLSRPEFPDIAVVRVVVPGLETACEHPFYLPGPRARAVAPPVRLRPATERMF